MLRALYHWCRMHYYRIALDHIHPTNPDMVLLSRRYIESRDIFNAFLTQQLNQTKEH
jgi:hypothetical protein